MGTIDTIKTEGFSFLREYCEKVTAMHEMSSYMAALMGSYADNADAIATGRRQFKVVERQARELYRRYSALDRRERTHFSESLSALGKLQHQKAEVTDENLSGGDSCNDPCNSGCGLNDFQQIHDGSPSAYNKAKHEYERLSALVNDLGPNHPDGALALKQAVQHGRETLDEYAEALRRR